MSAVFLYWIYRDNNGIPGPHFITELILDFKAFDEDGDFVLEGVKESFKKLEDNKRKIKVFDFTTEDCKKRNLKSGFQVLIPLRRGKYSPIGLKSLND